MIELSQAQLEKRLAKMPVPEISEDELFEAVTWEIRSWPKSAASVALGQETVKSLKQMAKNVKECLIFRKRFDEFSKTAMPMWDNKRNAFLCMGLDK